MSSAERVAKHRVKQKRAAQLEGYGFTEGTRPNENVRAKVRAAVHSGELDVPSEGFDDGTPWSWFPGMVRGRLPTELKTKRKLDL